MSPHSDPLTHALLSQNTADARAPRFFTGTVCGQAGAWHFVRGTAGEQRALAAPSCLLAPQDGDLALLCHTPDRVLSTEPDTSATTLPCHWYIVAVLARADAGSASLHLPGDVRLATDGGSLRIESRAIELAATTRIRACTAQLAVDALQADLRFGHARATAASVVACMGELRLLAHRLNARVDRLVQRARSSFRSVDEFDDVRAGRARWEIEGHAQLHAKQATVLAEGAVKIDGARVDLG